MRIIFRNNFTSHALWIFEKNWIQEEKVVENFHTKLFIRLFSKMMDQFFSYSSFVILKTKIKKVSCSLDDLISQSVPIFVWNGSKKTAQEKNSNKNRK